MEIEEKLYEQYRDTPYKIENPNQNQQILNLNDKNMENIKKPDAYNEFLKRINQSIKEPEGRRLTDNITLNTTIDGSTKNNDKESFLLNNNSFNNDKNAEIKNNSFKNDISLNLKAQNKSNNNKNEKRKYITYINNKYDTEISLEKKEHNYDKNNILNINNSNIEDKVMIDNKNNGGSNISQNYNNYYYSYNNENLKKMPANQLDYKNDDANINNTFKMPKFVLRVMNEKEECNKEDEGLFSGFFNLCKKKKENKNNQEIPNINNNNNNELDTIEQVLRAEPYDLNNNQLDEDNKKEINNENILLTSTPKENFKYKFILSNLLNDDHNSGINRLKNELNNNNKEDHFYLENKNQIQLGENRNNNEQNEGFIENQNIYYNQNKNDKKCYIIDAEPIENNVPSNNLIEEENNLGTSSEMIDFDKSSEYTLKTGTNFDEIVNKKSKLSPFLILMLIGSAGLLFLIYKNINTRQFLLNLLNKLKMVPDFFRGLFGCFMNGIDDFLERYNDTYRILGFLIALIIFWIIIRLLIKFMIKIYKKRK